LGRQYVAALGTRHPLGPGGAGHRPDGDSSGLFPAHHHWTGQHQQRAGAGVWHFNRPPGGRRFVVDHGESERKHDAVARADEFAHAALKWTTEESIPSNRFAPRRQRSPAMKVASPSRRVTSVHFRQRARHYRLAAALADAPRDVEMFLDLATMFEVLSAQFARA